MTETAYDEAGKLTQVQQFDYDALDDNLFPESQEELAELSQEDVDRALKLFRALLQWMFQNGNKNTDGLKIRAIIMCWVFLKELRPMTLSDLARGFGMDKQSIGRWVDEFKKDFPIRGPHMQAFKLPDKKL